MCGTLAGKGGGKGKGGKGGGKGDAAGATPESGMERACQWLRLTADPLWQAR